MLDGVLVFMGNVHACKTLRIGKIRLSFMMGFSTGVKGYSLWCLDSKKVVLSRDVTFNELKMLKLKVKVLDSSNGTPQPVEFETSMVP